MRLGLFQRKTVWLPTWRGWLAFVAAAAALLLLASTTLFPFLAVTEPAPGADYLVIEGWAPDDVLEQAVRAYRQGHYKMVITTGCPIDQGKYTIPYETYAEMCQAAMKKLGLTDQEAIAVPGGKTTKDRTFHSAVALRAWMATNHVSPKAIDLVTHACHARRSRLLFEKAFEGQLTVGILALESAEYNASNWWRCSAGVRDTVGEFIAYGYARFLFQPGKS